MSLEYRLRALEERSRRRNLDIDQDEFARQCRDGYAAYEDTGELPHDSSRRFVSIASEAVAMLDAECAAEKSKGEAKQQQSV